MTSEVYMGWVRIHTHDEVREKIFERGKLMRGAPCGRREQICFQNVRRGDKEQHKRERKRKKKR